MVRARRFCSRWQAQWRKFRKGEANTSRPLQRRNWLLAIIAYFDILRQFGGIVTAAPPPLLTTSRIEEDQSYDQQQPLPTFCFITQLIEESYQNEMAPPKKQSGKHSREEGSSGRDQQGDDAPEPPPPKRPATGGRKSSSSGGGSKKKKSQSKKPDSGYTFFFRHQHQELLDGDEAIESVFEREVQTVGKPSNRNKALVKVVSHRWNNLDLMERLKWETIAREAREKSKDSSQADEEDEEEEDDEQQHQSGDDLPSGAAAGTEGDSASGASQRGSHYATMEEDSKISASSFRRTAAGAADRSAGTSGLSAILPHFLQTLREATRNNPHFGSSFQNAPSASPQTTGAPGYQDEGVNLTDHLHRLSSIDPRVLEQILSFPTETLEVIVAFKRAAEATERIQEAQYRRVAPASSPPFGNVAHPSPSAAFLEQLTQHLHPSSNPAPRQPAAPITDLMSYQQQLHARAFSAPAVAAPVTLHQQLLDVFHNTNSSAAQHQHVPPPRPHAAAAAAAAYSEAQQQAANAAALELARFLPPTAPTSAGPPTDHLAGFAAAFGQQLQPPPRAPPPPYPPNSVVVNETDPALSAQVAAIQQILLAQQQLQNPPPG
mmetsp:Transcript_3857/g.8195  ORF Transcript_3857/g.8195 Transcript_3857/m.8195 type:complete len:604 (-) Transcript_3857:481-2292(-)